MNKNTITSIERRLQNDTDGSEYIYLQYQLTHLENKLSRSMATGMPADEFNKAECLLKAVRAAHEVLEIMQHRFYRLARLSQ